MRKTAKGRFTTMMGQFLQGIFKETKEKATGICSIPGKNFVPHKSTIMIRLSKMTH
jgi:hypothetical protein